MDYQTRIIYIGDTTEEYQLPLVQFESGSNMTGMKETIIEGTRADGCIIIPQGKKSQRITINGVILGEDYKEITDKMNTMKSNISTDVATLTMEHYYGGDWVTDWTYNVRRIGEIEFPASLRTSYQDYNINFIVLTY